ncbi:PQQ-binding-like beta-propeller repeat protein [Streptomyces sp. Y1]|uniref:PQQ-binding-like beta-propeller repeat protein n=1 Tax=Streptomyces sp. Y1 TaxID=3238634 RepID=A0AB39TNZ4_9ACTN
MNSDSDVNSGAAAQDRPARPQIDRRRLLLSAAGGAAALAVAGGARWWARRDAARGPRLWSTTAASGRVVLSGGPQDGLFVSGYDGDLRALDPRTGAVRWSRAVGAADPMTENYGRPSAVGDGVLSVAAPTGLQTLDAATGDVRWQVPVARWTGLTWGQGPVIGGGSVFAAHDGALNAYDAATGERRWSRPLGPEGYLALADDTVYAVGREYGARAFDARSGEQRWAQGSVLGAYNTPVLHRGALLLTYATEDRTGTWVCSLDAATGRVRWQRRHGATNCAVSAAGGTVCFLSGDTLSAMDTETGEPRWTATTTLSLGRGESSMTVADGSAYVGTNDERLFAFDLDTGKQQWQDAPDDLRSDTEYTRVSLAAAGTAVYRSTRTGVHALGTLS